MAKPANTDGDVRFGAGQSEHHAMTVAQRAEFVSGEYPHGFAERDELDRFGAHGAPADNASRACAIVRRNCPARSASSLSGPPVSASPNSGPPTPTASAPAAI